MGITLLMEIGEKFVASNLRFGLPLSIRPTPIQMAVCTSLGMSLSRLFVVMAFAIQDIAKESELGAHAIDVDLVNWDCKATTRIFENDNSPVARGSGLNDANEMAIGGQFE